MEEKRVRFKRYYTDYVNHMVRFFLSTKEVLELDGKKRCDIENWVAVQSVYALLSDEDKSMIRVLFGNTEERFEVLVNTWSATKCVPVQDVWVKVQRFTKDIATRRGLL